jgi:uncharacterized membrane protein
MGRLYWLLIAGLVAVASHIIYVLFVPAILFDRELARLTGDAPENRLFVLDPETQVQLFPAFPASSVVALCKYDLGHGSVRLTAVMPDSYWTLSIYGHDGRQFYSLNDAQSGTDQFTVKLSPTKGLLDVLLGSGNDEDVVDSSGWSVESVEKKGLAVLWTPVADPLMRRDALETMMRGTCS